jgi:hypothetical protein
MLAQALPSLCRFTELIHNPTRSHLRDQPLGLSFAVTKILSYRDDSVTFASYTFFILEGKAFETMRHSALTDVNKKNYYQSGFCCGNKSTFLDPSFR